MARKSQVQVEIERRIGELMGESEVCRMEAERAMEESARIETAIREFQDILEAAKGEPESDDEPDL